MSLPQELLDAIVQHIDDTPTLKACALAASSLRWASKRILLHSLELVVGDNHAAKCALLEESPHVASYVTELTLGIPDSSAGDIQSILGRLDNVRQCSFIGARERFARWSQLPLTLSSAYLQFISRQQSLHELTVLNIEELPLGVFLSLFRAASTLALRGMGVVQDDPTVSKCAPRAASRLVRLSIGPQCLPHPSPFLAHPDYASLTSSLTHLAIQMGTIEYTQLLRNTYLRRHNREVLWALDHIPFLPALRSIDYAGSLTIFVVPEILAQILALLALLAPAAFPRLARIAVTFDRHSTDTFLPALKADDMRRLDAALAAHPVGPYLTFRGQSKPFGSLVDNFGCEGRKALPLMHDSGRLIFEREGYGYRNWMRGHGDPSGLGRN